MLTALAIIALLAFILLFSGEKLPTANPDAEARALIQQYDSEDRDAARQSERNARLYRELAAILHAPIRSKRQRLPIIAIPLFLAASAAAIALWYQQNGQDALKWQRLQTALAPDTRQSQIFGADALKQPALQQRILTHTEQAQFFADSAQNHNTALLYCQALQRSIDRSDAVQLQALTSCYSTVGEYAYAEPVYDRLIRFQPNDPQTILAWAQAKSLAHPEQPIPDNVQNALIRLHNEQPNNLMAMLFLASSYQQRGDSAKAIPLWQQLKDRLPPTDPLYPSVSKALEAAKTKAAASPAAAVSQLTAQIRINPERLKNLPNTARLYLIAGSRGVPMPTAVKILPLQAEQNAILTDADTMRGGRLADTPNLELRLKLSPQGTAADPQAIETAAQPDNSGQAILTLP